MWWCSRCPARRRVRIADLPAAREQSWSPSLAVVLTYPERVWPDFHGAFVNDHPILATVFDDGDRRGDRAPVLVAYPTPEFAGGGDAGKLAAAVGEYLGIDDVPRIDEFRVAVRDPGAPPVRLRPGRQRLSVRRRLRPAPGADRLAERPRGGPGHHPGASQHRAVDLHRLLGDRGSS